MFHKLVFRKRPRKKVYLKTYLSNTPNTVDQIQIQIQIHGLKFDQIQIQIQIRRICICICICKYKYVFDPSPASWWPWFPSISSVLIYICICIPYMSSVIGRIYIYIQRECHSVLPKLHPITFYRIVFLGSARFQGWMPLFAFFGLPTVSCSLIKV